MTETKAISLMWAASTAIYFRGKVHQINHNDCNIYSTNLSLVYMDISTSHLHTFCNHRLKNHVIVGVEGRGICRRTEKLRYSSQTCLHIYIQVGRTPNFIGHVLQTISHCYFWFINFELQNWALKVADRKDSELEKFKLEERLYKRHTLWKRTLLLVI
jgi:hypothetical protein